METNKAVYLRILNEVNDSKEYPENAYITDYIYDGPIGSILEAMEEAVRQALMLNDMNLVLV